MMLKGVRGLLKKHPDLIPLLGCVTFACSIATLMMAKLAASPHVSWNKKVNPEPWNKVQRDTGKQPADFHQHRPAMDNDIYKNIQNKRETILFIIYVYASD